MQPMIGSMIRPMMPTHDEVYDKIIAFCIEPHSKSEIAEHCGYRNTKDFTKKIYASTVKCWNSQDDTT